MSGSFGDDFEAALRAFEAYLAEVAPSGRRHAGLDAHSNRLHALRSEVIGWAEALPVSAWPRPACGHCAGRREVEAMQAGFQGGGDSPEFDSVRRMCPRCWGTGLALHVEE